jgi:hypothetical protein
MSYSNLDSFSSVSLDNVETVYNIDLYDNQIFKITNKEEQRIALFEHSVTSGLLKTMNNISFEITKEEDPETVYKIMFRVDGIGQEPIEINSALSVFRIPLLLSVIIKNSEVSFKTFLDLTFTNSLETVFSNPSDNGFKISFSTTKIRDVTSSVASVFMIETVYISPPIYITKENNTYNFKVIKNSNGSVNDIYGKLLYNIIRCI